MKFIPLPEHTEYFELEMRFPKEQYRATDIESKARWLNVANDSRFSLTLMSFTLPDKGSNDYALTFLLIAAWKSARKAPSAFEKFLRSVKRNFTKHIAFVKIHENMLSNYCKNRVELAKIRASRANGLSRSQDDIFDEMNFNDNNRNGFGMGMFYHDPYDLYNYPIERWVLKPKKGILHSLAKLRGFPEFKQGLKALMLYGTNAQKRGVRSCLNTVLVKNCEADTAPLLSLMYDFLVTHGLLQEYVLTHGHIKDVTKGMFSYTNMYIATNMWDVDDEDSVFFRASNLEEEMRKAVHSKSVIVTEMNIAEYKKMVKYDCFRQLFPHVIEINEHNTDDKYLELELFAESYGLKLDEKNIRNSNVLQLSTQALNAAVVEASTKLLKTEKVKLRPMVAKDFDCDYMGQKTNPFEELDYLIGLDTVKQHVREITTLLQKRGKDILPCLHMCFRGNPGTGKTTVARIIGRIFSETGILAKRNVFVETDREGLVGKYVGFTAPKTKEKVKSAIGGVLFIDEAYSLASSESGVDYGQEALAALVKQMEDFRKDFVCIMAGYTEEMDDMIKVNPGLRDRIQLYIDFPDYSAEELLEIFIGMCDSEFYTADDRARTAIADYLNRIVSRKDKNFANARLVRKVFERVRVKQALRSDLFDISAADIECVFQDPDMQALLTDKNAKAIGFV